jgi:hypothetical protein
MANFKNDELVHSDDFLAEAEAYEYDMEQLLAGNQEAPPWTTREAVAEHYRECAARMRAEAAKLKQEGK